MVRLARFGAIVGMVVLAGSMPALAQQKTLTVAGYGGSWEQQLRKQVFPAFEAKHGDWLFANLQSPGITFAITGPWADGGL